MEATLLALLFFKTIHALAADGDIDLGAMDPNFYNPYLVERNRWWMLLPAFILFVLMLHTIDRRKKRRKR